MPRRSKRHRKFPAEYGQVEATSYTQNANIPMAEETIFEQRLEPPQPVQEPEALLVPDISKSSRLHSDPNSFGVFKVFAEPPHQLTPMTEQIPAQSPLTHPFANNSIYEMMKIKYLAPSSHTDLGSDIIATNIAHMRLNPGELQGYRSISQTAILDKYGETSPINGGPWKSGSVRIKMPRTGTRKKGDKSTPNTERHAPEFEITGFRYRSLVDMITSRVQQLSTFKSFTGTAFTEWWCPPGSPVPIRLYGEAYSSDVAIKLHDEIKSIPAPPEHPGIQSVVVLLMLGSDSTHLAQFGTASLWPLYVYFGNESKYTTGKESQCPAYHLAYLPKVRRIHFMPYLYCFSHLPFSYQKTLQMHTRRRMELSRLQTSSLTVKGS